MSTTAKELIAMSVPMTYRGYTIESCVRGYDANIGNFMFYPTEQGVDHDADYDGESYKYCGNCRWADSIEEAKDEIFEKVMTEKPVYLVKTKGPYWFLGIQQINLTKFWWIEEAVKFALKENGILLTEFKNI